ncbi:asparagine synthase (glutamine-hydrolyzing) [Bifidobacterium aquikefiricola]|uniref:asparagine synthase (glutamine-hydrolyzing) n=1 Tax=Bifidobacterium aquikefiricola TaxID=3059038 RepID=A0AB39U4M9_9BIFI
MCGIAGFVSDAPEDVKRRVLKDMTDIIAHRGPDSEGHLVDAHAALGFRRLSIIDLRGGDQPIYNEDRTMAITFNGEIYNFEELRKQLIELGHDFTTKSDTEVILHGYEQWGTGVLNKLRGMFAFVIWNSVTKELFGARDQFGIKPFYYAMMGDTFMYASEIKSMLQHPDFVKTFNADALKPYMTFQYSPLDETFFKGVFKLKEGHYFTYKNHKLDIHEYWDPAFGETKQHLDDLVESVDETVKDSVRHHLIADVEVGSFLSSGVDSSYVTALAKPEHTYSIGFGKDTYNESTQAKDLAKLLDVDNTSATVKEDEAFAYFPQIQWYMDEPDSNPSCIPLFFLARMASRDLSVVLSGEGADELFGGYLGYGVHTRSKLIKVITRILAHLPSGVRQGIAQWCKGKSFHGAWHLYANLSQAENSFIGQARVFNEKESEQLLKPEYRNGPSVRSIVSRIYDRIKGKHLSEIKKKQYLDLHQWMPGDILLKADKLTMASSLELRVPLLDMELMKVAEKVPTKYLINDENTKYAFRLAAARHIPKEWYDREKLGFPVPIKKWLREERCYLHVRSMFTKDFVPQFFDQQALLTMIDDNYANRVDARRKIWTIYTFLVWYDIYFIHDGLKPVPQSIATAA